MNTEKIPVTIITGFLGSGKTTLLNHILTQPHGRKIAVIENEFGEIGIDHELVIRDEEEIFETSNGCVCCSVRGDLLRILEDLISYRNKFDSVIIETTGLADPAPVAQTFFYNEDIRAHYELEAIVTVVDAKHILHSLRESIEAQKQISCADLLLLNKTDLVTEEEKKLAEKAIHAINPLLRIIETRHAAIDPWEIIEVRDFAMDRSFRGLDPSAPHSHSGKISSLAFIEPEALNFARFEAWLHELTQARGEDIFRIKGILNFSGERRRYILQGMHMMIELSPERLWRAEEKRESRMVCIGRGLERGELEAAIKSCRE